MSYGEKEFLQECEDMLISTDVHHDPNKILQITRSMLCGLIIMAQKGVDLAKQASQQKPNPEASQSPVVEEKAQTTEPQANL